MTRRQILALSLITLAAVGGCKKKDRLTASTFQYAITPAAQLVVIGHTHDFSIVTSQGGSPEWVVSASTVGSLNVSLGPKVTFTANGYGDVHILATLNGVTAVSYVTVVSSYSASIPGPFGIYNDAGIPTGSTLFISPPDTPGVINLQEQKQGLEWTPEGTNFMRTVMGAGGPARVWGISLPAIKDKSAFFPGGSLKFWIRLNRDLNTDQVQIRLEQGSPSVKAPVTLVGTFQFDRTSTDWQEVTIPLSNFAIDPTKVLVPFSVLLNSVSTPLTLDVDAVRWE